MSTKKRSSDVLDKNKGPNKKPLNSKVVPVRGDVLLVTSPRSQERKSITKSKQASRKEVEGNGRNWAALSAANTKELMSHSDLNGSIQYNDLIYHTVTNLLKSFPEFPSVRKIQQFSQGEPNNVNKFFGSINGPLLRKAVNVMLQRRACKKLQIALHFLFVISHIVYPLAALMLSQLRRSRSSGSH